MDHRSRSCAEYRAGSVCCVRIWRFETDFPAVGIHGGIWWHVLAVLSESAPQILGLSEETTCYVSPEYFAESDPFADFIVHEAAHIFHNCKRGTVGLRQTRTKDSSNISRTRLTDCSKRSDQ